MGPAVVAAGGFELAVVVGAAVELAVVVGGAVEVLEEVVEELVVDVLVAVGVLDGTWNQPAFCQPTRRISRTRTTTAVAPRPICFRDGIYCERTKKKNGIEHD
jgi:hypothetical protein